MLILPYRNGIVKVQQSRTGLNSDLSQHKVEWKEVKALGHLKLKKSLINMYFKDNLVIYHLPIMLPSCVFYTFGKIYHELIV